jgi:hypothetical protein
MKLAVPDPISNSDFPPVAAVAPGFWLPPILAGGLNS